VLKRLAPARSRPAGIWQWAWPPTAAEAEWAAAAAVSRACPRRAAGTQPRARSSGLRFAEQRQGQSAPGSPRCRTLAAALPLGYSAGAHKVRLGPGGTQASLLVPGTNRAYWTAEAGNRCKVVEPADPLGGLASPWEAWETVATQRATRAQPPGLLSGGRLRQGGGSDDGTGLDQLERANPRWLAPPVRSGLALERYSIRCATERCSSQAAQAAGNPIQVFAGCAKQESRLRTRR